MGEVQSVFLLLRSRQKQKALQTEGETSLNSSPLPPWVSAHVAIQVGRRACKQLAPHMAVQQNGWSCPRTPAYAVGRAPCCYKVPPRDLLGAGWALGTHWEMSCGPDSGSVADSMVTSSPCAASVSITVR